MTAFLGNVQQTKSRGSRGWVGLLSVRTGLVGCGLSSSDPTLGSPTQTTLQRLDGRWSGDPSWGGGGGAGGIPGCALGGRCVCTSHTSLNPGPPLRLEVRAWDSHTVLCAGLGHRLVLCESAVK